MTTIQDYKLFEEKIGYSFSEKKLLESAFTHRSFINEKEGRGKEHNERLEFLGDAVLELIITDFLFNKFPKEPEGVMTSYRAAMVNTDSLSAAAQRIEAEKYLMLSRGEKLEKNKGRDHILANTFEAVMGALYLDGGFDNTRRVVSTFLFPFIDEIISKKLYKDPKSYFQEKAQEIKKQTPYYQLIREVGPDHDKEFIMGVFLGEELIAEGGGQSKQKAEASAAEAALEAMGWDV